MVDGSFISDEELGKALRSVELTELRLNQIQEASNENRGDIKRLSERINEIKISIAKIESSSNEDRYDVKELRKDLKENIQSVNEIKISVATIKTGMVTRSEMFKFAMGLVATTIVAFFVLIIRLIFKF